MLVTRALLVLAVLLAPAAAGAVTVRDIIELTKAGLSDDVLVAVIEADLTIFTLDKDQILELKEAGVSDTVLLKMLRTRGELEPAGNPEPVVPPQPGLVVIGASPAPAPVVVQQHFYLPYSIWGAPIWGTPVPHGSRLPPKPVLDENYRGFGRFINDGWIERRPF